MRVQRLHWSLWLPTLGVAGFLLAYAYAAGVYPGGTRLDAHTIGYSHLANYWCDLLDAVAYDGRPNPGRPVALAATVALPLTLAPLWFSLPALFGVTDGRSRALAATVRGAGVIALCAAAVVFTPWHDVAINIGAAAGSLAGIAALAGLVRGKQWILAGAGFVAAGAATANYVLWATGTAPDITPIAQKGAYAVVLAWAVIAIRTLAATPVPKQITIQDEG